MDGTDRPMTAVEVFIALNKDIQALTERVDKLEDRLANHFHPEPWTPKPDVLGDPEIKVAMDKWKAAKPAPVLNDGKAQSSKYCTCESETDTWFDRTMTTDGKGNVLQDMCTRCCVCGKELASTPEESSIIILDHPMDHMVSDEELDNIYVSPAVNSWPKPMWEVARGNTMRGILYSFEDAKLFAEVIKY
jgi:hypothetical protein